MENSVKWNKKKRICTKKLPIERFNEENAFDISNDFVSKKLSNATKDIAKIAIATEIPRNFSISTFFFGEERRKLKPRKMRVFLWSYNILVYVIFRINPTKPLA